MALQVLIKPVSDSCNMACEYCFYRDETSRRAAANRGVMSEETLTRIVSETLRTADRQCVLGFQGGEPSLRGLDFYRRLLELEQQYNERGVEIVHLFQTNGLLLNREWAAFFRENRFLVGLSLDGSQAVNDRFRVDRTGGGTYARVLMTAELLQREGVDFNILTVVTRELALHIKEIYQDYIDRGLVNQQYVPCLDPIGRERGMEAYSLIPADYERFLFDLFDEWYTDRLAGRYVYIKQFEELAGIILGHPPVSCGMQGRCSRHLVIEADGSTYPCDFYTLDEFQTGNINESPIEEILFSRREADFLMSSGNRDLACMECRYRALCRGGCRRDRMDSLPPFRNVRNYYCESIFHFFEYAVPRLEKLLSK